MLSIRSFLIYLAALCCSSAQVPPPEPPQPVNDYVRVAVLGYHDFSTTRKVKEMVIRPAKFRSQMQAIKDLKLNVITLEDFILWKQGKKTIPDKSVLITIDDGWKSVYTDAYPILKEFGYPFTIYLYTNYIDRGGSSMTSEMIHEMMKNGCTIGSHSVSHPMPSIIRKHQRKGAAAYKKFIDNELGESKKILELNPAHPVITSLEQLSTDKNSNASFKQRVEMLLELARVLSGSKPENPADFGRFVAELMG